MAIALSFIESDDNPSINFKKIVITTIGKKYITNLILTQLLNIISHQHINDDKNIILTSVIVNIGSKMIFKYKAILKQAYDKQSDISLSFSDWNIIWEKECESKNIDINDTLKAELGSKVMEILESSDMIKRVLVTTRYNEKQYKYYITDKSLLSDNNKSIIRMPTKLAMIVPPKKYSKTSLGGYLLNVEKYNEDLFIPKSGYLSNSKVLENNSIYDMVNNMSSTPFKINTQLLDYLNNFGVKKGLLLDIHEKHRFESVKKINKYQEKTYSSDRSKVILQETILSLAEFYRNFTHRAMANIFLLD